MLKERRPGVGLPAFGYWYQAMILHGALVAHQRLDHHSAVTRMNSFVAASGLEALSVTVTVSISTTVLSMC